ncbi:hypothetical protein ATN84_20835 [Paramesorhizobium deserti]|uniref:Uncharacterized protein n=1 Tax=Paramesorhizobium deserti TaxID=1494590 RepID=A0A135HPJ1_9HYPH|nr:hypothetical protein [Paramesorhizobium deserti]KXF75124.1 hypothetical protein ATN84_20835 [Paramesorhizobium deserti]
MPSYRRDISERSPAWPTLAKHFAFGLAIASSVQAVIDLFYWYTAQWFFIGSERFLAGDALAPMDSFVESLIIMTAITAATAFLPALALTAFCRWRGIPGPAAYVIGGALTGVMAVLVTVSDPFHQAAAVYAAGLGISGAASGYIFWRASLHGINNSEGACL